MTITDEQFDTVATFAHRAQLFQDAMNVNNLAPAYTLATEGENRS